MENEEKLKEIIKMGYALKWVFPPANIKDSDGKDYHSEYPLMILSEVEKCMLAMVDEEYFSRIKRWYEELITNTENKK